MSEVVAQFDSLDAVFTDGAMRLLRSDYAQASVALLRTLFGDGTSRMESEILYARVDALLDELDHAGCKGTSRRPSGGRGGSCVTF